MRYDYRANASRQYLALIHCLVFFLACNTSEVPPSETTMPYNTVVMNSTTAGFSSVSVNNSVITGNQFNDRIVNVNHDDGKSHCISSNALTRIIIRRQASCDCELDFLSQSPNISGQIHRKTGKRDWRMATRASRI